MKIDVKLNGMEEINAAVENAHRCMQELMKAVDEIDRRLHSLGMEITQPPEKPAAE